MISKTCNKATQCYRHHSTFPKLLTTAMNHLLTFCGSRDHAVRLAASDVLNKTIKVSVAKCVVCSSANYAYRHCNRIT